MTTCSTASCLPGVTLFVTAILSVASAETPQRFDYQQAAMGVPVRISVYACQEGLANNAAAAAFRRIDEINQIMSDYQSDSELMRLCREARPGIPFKVSPELAHVLAISQHIARTTDGHFDVTVGQVVRLWRRARRQKVLPAQDRLDAAMAVTGYSNLKVEGQFVTLGKPGMRIDLGGIAKGYATDEALRTLRSNGITSAMIDAGGDLRVGAPPPGKTHWTIAVAPLKRQENENANSETRSEPSQAQPDQTQAEPIHELLTLKDSSVATSGDAYQFVEIDGTRYSHIVNPHTGLGMTVHSSVTVIAPEGILSDSLASAVTVLGPVEGLRLIEKTPNVECHISWMGNDTLLSKESSGFAKYREKEPTNR